MKILLVMLIFVASSAHGEIYRWTDSKGTTHYTNSEYEIPERYRARAKVLDLGIEEKKGNSTPLQDVPQEQNETMSQGEQVQPVQPTEPSEFQSPRTGQHGRKNRPSLLGDQ
jgi:hypothetical protein